MQKLFFLFILIACIFACEKTGVDTEPTIVVSDPNLPGITTEANQSIFYTWQGNDVAVDISTLPNLGNVTSITIIEQPKYGTAAFTNNFLFYSPDESVVEADDQAVVEIKTTNKPTIKEVYFFKIKAKNTDIPCHTGALSDKFDIEEKKSVVLDVLKNDNFCDATTYIIGSLKVVVAPKKGKINIKNDKIEFAPDVNFDKGNDNFVYEISVKDSEGKILRRSAVSNIAIVEKNTSGGSNCKMQLIDDVIAVSLNTPFDTISINPLDNDKLCNTPNLGKLEILANQQSLKFGTATVTNTNTIVYKRNKNIPPLSPNSPPVLDEIRYKFTQNGQVDEATIKLKKQEGSNTNCTTKVGNDEINISLSNKKIDFAKGFILANVLFNDFICGGEAKNLKLKDIVAPSGKLTLENYGWVKYVPTSGKFEKGTISFMYEFEDGNAKSFSVKAKIKFVD